MSHPVHDIIRCSHVTVRYGARLALADVTASIPCGTATAILGPNGAGKSTLLRTLLGWHAIENRGEIRIGDTHAHHQLPRLAYLPQRHAIDWDFPITVRAVVAQGRYPSLRPWHRRRPSDHAALERALGDLGLPALARQRDDGVGEDGPVRVPWLDAQRAALALRQPWSAAGFFFDARACGWVRVFGVRGACWRA